MELNPQLLKTFELFNDSVYLLNDAIKAKEIKVEIFDGELIGKTNANSKPCNA